MGVSEGEIPDGDETKGVTAGDEETVGVAAIGEKAAGVITDIGVADGAADGVADGVACGVAAMMTISANGDWLTGSVSAWLTAGAASLAA